MKQRSEFLCHASKSDLTAEQLSVLLYVLAYEADGLVQITRKEIARELGLQQADVTRTLIKAGVLSNMFGRCAEGKAILEPERTWIYREGGVPKSSGGRG
jgi:hypothetical protein